jgi:hypothetical protein
MLAAVLAAAALAAGVPNPIQTENALGGTQPSEWLPQAVPTTAIEGLDGAEDDRYERRSIGGVIAMNGARNAVAVWPNAATGAIRGAIRPAGGAWQPPVRVSAPERARTSHRTARCSQTCESMRTRECERVSRSHHEPGQPRSPERRRGASATARTPLGRNVTHIYASAGTRTVTVSQRDASGATSTATRKIVVKHA